MKDSYILSKLCDFPSLLAGEFPDHRKGRGNPQRAWQSSFEETGLSIREERTKQRKRKRVLDTYRRSPSSLQLNTDNKCVS